MLNETVDITSVPFASTFDANGMISLNCGTFLDRTIPPMAVHKSLNLLYDLQGKTLEIQGKTIAELYSKPRAAILHTTFKIY